MSYILIHFLGLGYLLALPDADVARERPEGGQWLSEFLWQKMNDIIHFDAFSGIRLPPGPPGC